MWTARGPYNKIQYLIADLASADTVIGIRLPVIPFHRKRAKPRFFSPVVFRLMYGRPKKSMNTHHRARDLKDIHCAVADGFRSSQLTAQLFHNDLLQVEHKVDGIQKDVGIINSAVRETNRKVGTLAREVGSLCVAAEEISVRFDGMADELKTIRKGNSRIIEQNREMNEKLDTLLERLRKSTTTIDT